MLFFQVLTKPIKHQCHLNATINKMKIHIQVLESNPQAVLCAYKLENSIYVYLKSGKRYMCLHISKIVCSTSCLRFSGPSDKAETKRIAISKFSRDSRSFSLNLPPIGFGARILLYLLISTTTTLFRFRLLSVKS